MRIILIIITTCIASIGHSFTLDMDAFYFSDSFKNSSTETSGKTIYDVAALLSLDKKGYFLLGWNYSSQSISDKTTSETTYTLTEMGPKIVYYMDKDKVWGLFFTYNLNATTDYNDGTAVEWRGSSYKASISFAPPLDDDDTYYLGGKINYSVATYKEEVNGSTVSTISYSRTVIYPSIQFTMHFN